MEAVLTIPDVAIGPKIQEVFERKNLKLSDFADELGTVRQNVYRIFKKKDLDTGLLMKVSEVLNHNFFHYYQTPSGETGSGGQGSSDLVQQLELARKEIDYLKKIINLMEEKGRLLQLMNDNNSSTEDQNDRGQKEDKISNKAIALF